MYLYRKLTVIFVIFLGAFFVAATIINIFWAKSFISSYIEKVDREVLGALKEIIVSEDKADVKSLSERVDRFIKTTELESVTLYDIKGNVIIKRYKEKKELSTLGELFSFGDVESSIDVQDSYISKIEGRTARENLDGFTGGLVASFAAFSLLFSLGVLIVLKLFTSKLSSFIDRSSVVIQEIGEGHFIKENTAPPVKEFSTLVEAAEKATRKVQEVYKESKKTKEDYNELLYKDPVTKLYNRKYFMSKIFNYIGDKSLYEDGVFILYSFSGLEIAREKLGFGNLESLLVNIAKDLSESIESFKHSIVSRMNDNDFSVIVPSTEYDNLKPYIEKSFRSIRRSFKEYGLKDGRVFMGAGGVSYTTDLNVGSLFSKGDYALSNAKIYGRHYLFFLEDDKDTLILGKEQWKDLISKSMETNTLSLYIQEVFQKEELFSKEILLRMEQDEKIYSAQSFLPVLANFNLLKDVDEYVLRKFHLLLEGGELPKGRYAINLSASFVTDPVMVSFFKSTYKNAKDLEGYEIVFESTHSDVVKNLLIYKDFVDLLSYRGYKFAIDNFVFLEEEYNYITDLKPLYIKMDKESLIIKTERESEQYNVLAGILREYSGFIIAAEVGRERDKKVLESLNIEYLQGDLLAKPSKLS